MAKIEISPGRPWSDLYPRRQPAVHLKVGGGGVGDLAHPGERDIVGCQ